MSTEENKALVRRMWAETLSGNLDVIDDLVDPNVTHHSAPPALPPGIEGYREFNKLFLTGFPDLQMDIDQMIAEGDLVAVHWTARGTHQGDFGGIPPTGKPMMIRGVSIVRIVNGKLVEEWEYPQELSLMQQLGVLSESEAEQAPA